ncbi:hypothetical protein D3C77_611530 [compost metagenome]
MADHRPVHLTQIPVQGAKSLYPEPFASLVRPHQAQIGGSLRSHQLWRQLHDPGAGGHLGAQASSLQTG